MIELSKAEYAHRIALPLVNAHLETRKKLELFFDTFEPLNPTAEAVRSFEAFFEALLDLERVVCSVASPISPGFGNLALKLEAEQLLKKASSPSRPPFS